MLASSVYLTKLLINQSAKDLCLIFYASVRFCAISYYFEGETGLGKSTLIETLFNQKFDFVPSSHDSDEVKVKSKTYGMLILDYFKADP